MQGWTDTGRCCRETSRARTSTIWAKQKLAKATASTLRGPDGESPGPGPSNAFSVDDGGGPRPGGFVNSDYDHVLAPIACCHLFPKLCVVVCCIVGGEIGHPLANGTHKRFCLQHLLVLQLLLTRAL